MGIDWGVQPIFQIDHLRARVQARVYDVVFYQSREYRYQ